MNEFHQSLFMRFILLSFELVMSWPLCSHDLPMICLTTQPLKLSVVTKWKDTYAGQEFALVVIGSPAEKPVGRWDRSPLH